MNKNTKRIVALSVCAMAIGAGIMGFSRDDHKFKLSKNLDIFLSVFKQVEMSYVRQPDPDKLIAGAIDGMLSTLDPYTSYIPEKDKEAYNFQINGKYGGVGAVIQLSPDTNYIQIKEIYKGTPSDKIGMRAGDRFVSIDGESMKGKNVSDVSNKLRGKEGTKAKVVVKRIGEAKPLTFDITREVIKLDAVNYYGMVDDQTGIIMLTGFETDCAKSVAKAFKDLRDNHGAKKMILDLRYNPGGLLDEALQIVNLFVPEGSPTLKTHGRSKMMDRTYTANHTPIDTVMPIVVLINRASASASEIVSGALQDLDRAVIAGQRSFGKGLVQATQEVAYNGLVKVTTAKYYTPSGRCIQAIDYSTRDENGAVNYVPDSLISEFKTKGGRKVYDGGGISPDVMLESRKYTPVTYALIAQDYAFRYIINLMEQGKALNLDKDGFMSDADFEDFISFIKSQKKIHYKSKSQDAFEKMVSTAKREDMYSNLENEFKKIEEAVKPNLERDMRAAASELKEFIETEAIRLSDYRTGAVRHSIKTDDQIAKAIELLADEKRYKGLLDGSVPSHAGDKRATKEALKESANMIE